MMTCETCQSQVPDSSRFCLTCGNPIAGSNPDAATMVIEPAVASAPPTPSSRPSGASSLSTRLQMSSSPKSGRFQPGTVLAGRYQIVGLLGKGGMGEVHRAHDLTLDQPVALKFLPDNMADNPAMLARFHGEVRIARQVSHPNVCRVYDIGEVDGQLFLSMEYVDGEDLGSLLRRIGRLPLDKGIEFARRICAGLAAAHDKGVLHRDLKPANIMIDSQGKVVIMDFGLAGVADQIRGLEIRAGTPAYMSPEQLAGREVSIRSDIYALGLVLYEMFTGKRAFECGTMAELIEKQLETQALSLATVVKEMDPAVDAVILRCLSPDPKDRPGSALAVAAALPGGDRLAAALAAGETPSPEVVAASGATAGMRPLWAVVCGAVVLMGLVAVAILGPMTRVVGMAPLDLPPDALTLKARDIVQALGYTQRPVATARGFNFDIDYLRYLKRSGTSPNRWSRISNAQPAPVAFWYRQSPRYLEPLSERSRADMMDPPQILSGMLSVQLDPKGRLIGFSAVPPQVDNSPAAPAPVDWKPLFAAAGLDLARLSEIRPIWTPLAAVDTRAAWEGVWPEMPEAKLRVEAAAWKGRVVYFDMIGPWTRPWRTEGLALTPVERTLRALVLFLAVGLLLGASLLARYNHRRGRGDRRGAMRIAVAGFSISVSSMLLASDYFPTPGLVGRLFLAIASALLLGGCMWVGYMALEPYVRRHWPGAIVSWTRLLAGGVRDPLVGRDVLIGVALGVVWGLIYSAGILVEMKDGGPAYATQLPILLGARQSLGAIFGIIPGSFIQLFVTFFFLFVLRLVLRKQWLAAIAFLGLYTLLQIAGSASLAIDTVLNLAVSWTIYFAMTRFGFVTFVTALYVFTLLLFMPVTIDPGAWYAGASGLTLLAVVGLGAYGMHAALAGRSIIEDHLL
jgi:predicted Ser/Thr protein kinase